MPTDISALLTSLGLTAIETKVYLSSLELGPSSVQNIAKKARISRTACYDAIDALAGRGLVSSYVSGKKRFFSAEEPDRAVSHFRHRILSMQEQIERLESAVPELRMRAGGLRPVVRFFEGEEAVYALFRDIAASNARYAFEVTNLDDVEKFLDRHVLEEARKAMDPKHVDVRVLYTGSVVRSVRNGVHVAQVPTEFAGFHGDIWIYGDRVAFINFIGRIILVILEQAAFAEVARVAFETAWISGQNKRTGAE